MNIPLDLDLELFDQQTRGMLHRAYERDLTRNLLKAELGQRVPNQAVIRSLALFLKAA